MAPQSEDDRRAEAPEARAADHTPPPAKQTAEQWEVAARTNWLVVALAFLPLFVVPALMASTLLEPARSLFILTLVASTTTYLAIDLRRVTARQDAKMGGMGTASWVIWCLLFWSLTVAYYLGVRPAYVRVYGIKRAAQGPA